MLIVRPDYIFSIFTKYGESLSLHIFAVSVRILLGVALVLGASDSKFPIVLQILGWLTISVALIVSAIGRERFKSLIMWSVKVTPPFQRLMGILAIIFGCFLINAIF